MGFLSDDEQSQSNEIMQQEVDQNKAELEAKKQSLFKTQLDIIKGEGGQSFSPDRTQGVSSSSGSPAAGIGVGGGFLGAIQKSPVNLR